jgi:peptide deformylase
MDPQGLLERDRRPVPFTVLMNPKIQVSGATAEFFEGCLSMAGFSAIVPRALEARVDYLDHNGEPAVIAARGWHARILQHEIDHLHGTVYVDRMLPRSLTTAENLTRYWKSKSLAEIRTALHL